MNLPHVAPKPVPVNIFKAPHRPAAASAAPYTRLQLRREKPASQPAISSSRGLGDGRSKLAAPAEARATRHNRDPDLPRKQKLASAPETAVPKGLGGGRALVSVATPAR